MNFWERCVKVGCVIAALKVYSAYRADGWVDESKFEGIRFVALQFESDAVGPRYYFDVEVSHAGKEGLYNTPEEALAAYERIVEEYEQERKKGGK